MAEIQIPMNLVMDYEFHEHDDQCEAQIVVIRAWSRCHCDRRGCGARDWFDGPLETNGGSVVMTPARQPPAEPDPIVKLPQGWKEIGWTEDHGNLGIVHIRTDKSTGDTK